MNSYLSFCLICNRKLVEHTDKELVFCSIKICEEKKHETSKRIFKTNSTNE